MGLFDKLKNQKDDSSSEIKNNQNSINIKEIQFIGKDIKKNWFKEMEEREIFLLDEKLIALIGGIIESRSIPLTGDDPSITKALGTNVREGLIGLTNKRVIFYMPKMLNRYEFESYTLEQISSIQFTKGMINGRIQVTAFNDSKVIKWVDNDGGKIITDMIQKATNIIKFKDQNTNHTSQKDDPISILKIRYAKGEITREEFEQMKKELDG